jgi:hypothetical protein
MSSVRTRKNRVSRSYPKGKVRLMSRNCPELLQRNLQQGRIHFRTDTQHAVNQSLKARGFEYHGFGRG